MIFITVGTDSSFDRMLKTIDAWAKESARSDIFAQIGKGGWKPPHIPHQEFLEPSEYRKTLNQAKLVIGHAGMGTILTTLSRGLPVLVMPKKASLGEHRNEHQTATAEHFSKLGKVYAAYDDQELRSFLDKVDTLTPKQTIGPWAGEPLTDRLHHFIHQA